MAERQVQPELVDRVADWGVTVAEARAKPGAKKIALTLLGYSLVFVGAILILPILAGTILRFESQGIIAEIAIISAIALLGTTLKLRANSFPRNALQIDHRASEIRLGSERANGVFVRQRVASFRDIGDVRVGENDELILQLRGDVLTLHFNASSRDNLERLSAQIAAARESALRAPIRSRIQSRIMGFEASVREVKTRLTSRIA